VEGKKDVDRFKMSDASLGTDGSTQTVWW